MVGIIASLLCDRCCLVTGSFSDKEEHLQKLRPLSTHSEFDQADLDLRKADSERACPLTYPPPGYDLNSHSLICTYFLMNNMVCMHITKD